MKENKKMIIFIVILGITIVLVKLLFGSSNKTTRLDIDSIIKNKKTMLIYVGSKDSKKCSKCSEVINYLDKENIKYSKYIIEDYSKDDYNNMLKSFNINSKDFGYPAIIYIKEGKLYSNLINIPNTKLIDNYIKDYNLGSVK